jgi:hypothetical protein
MSNLPGFLVAASGYCPVALVELPEGSIPLATNQQNKRISKCSQIPKVIRGGGMVWVGD